MCVACHDGETLGRKKQEGRGELQDNEGYIRLCLKRKEGKRGGKKLKCLIWVYA